MINANKLGVYEQSEKKADRLVYEPGRGSKGAIGIHRVQDGKWKLWRLMSAVLNSHYLYLTVLNYSLIYFYPRTPSARNSNSHINRDACVGKIIYRLNDISNRHSLPYVHDKWPGTGCMYY